MRRSRQADAEYHSLKNAICPELVFNQTLYEDLLNKNISSETRWLDAGCGHKVLPSWREDSERLLVGRARIACGCDTDVAAIKRHRSIRARVICDLRAMPFKGGSLDLVTCNMVAEHLDNPKDVFLQFARVLAPGGIVIVHTPNQWSYFAIASSIIPQVLKNYIGAFLDKREARDYYPVKYLCNTPAKLKELFSNAGLEEVELRMFSSDAVLRSMAANWLGAIFLRLELYLIKLSMQPSWRKFRVTLCGVYRKPGSGFPNL
ncbi:methyltransferase domain-containing protein [Candidatus Nitrospira bockiana]